MRRRHHLLLVGVCLLIFNPGEVSASPLRVATLGGDSRLLVDPTNIFVYPSLAGEMPHAVVELFDNWAGIAFPVTDSHAAGLFLNRPTDSLERLNLYLDQTGSRLFRSLEAEPVADLIYAVSLAGPLRMGVAGRFSRDHEERQGMTASASAADLTLGFGVGARDGLRLDSALGVRRRRFEDGAVAGARLEETDGDGYSLDLRVRLPASEGALLLMPFVSVEKNAYALAPTTRDDDVVSAGLGLNARPAPGILAVAGILFAQRKVSTREPGLPRHRETATTSPAIILATEAQVGSMVFRLGVRHDSRFLKQVGGEVPESRSFDASVALDLGLGLEFGSVLLDGYLERDFLRDGPHIIGGSRHGGGIFSKVGVTYRFYSLTI